MVFKWYIGVMRRQYERSYRQKRVEFEKYFRGIICVSMDTT